MKLTVYTTEDFPAMSRAGSPTIRFNCKSGVVTISGVAAERVGITPGDAILIANDEDKPKDWYLCKSDQDNAFKLKRVKSGAALSFNNTGLCRKIRSSLGTEIISFTAPVAAESITSPMSSATWPIITMAIPVKQ